FVLGPRVTTVGIDPENVITAELNKCGIPFGASLGQIAGTERIDCECRLGLGFGAIDEVIRGAIDDDVGPSRLNGRPKQFRIGKVGLFAPRGYDLTGQPRSQVAPELTVRADEQELGHKRPLEMKKKPGRSGRAWNLSRLLLRRYRIGLRALDNSGGLLLQFHL